MAPQSVELASVWRGVRTGSDLCTSCSQLIDGLLDVADARRQVCAALEELHLLAEVVHGGGVAEGGGYEVRREGAVVQREEDDDR
jgi:hypothetical protein